MTQPQPSPAGPRPDRQDGLPWMRTLLLALLMVVVIGAGFGIWYIFFRPGGPAPVGTGAPVIPGASAVAATPASTPAGGSAARRGSMRGGPGRNDQ